MVAEISPYEVDLDWGELTEPDDIAAVVELLGRATAKIHCASDEDSDEDLVDFQVESGIRRVAAPAAQGVRRLAHRLRAALRRPGARRPRLFVEAFRDGRVGVSCDSADASAALGAPADGTARRWAGEPNPSSTNAASTARITASTRSSGTTATLEPPKPPPVIRAADGARLDRDRHRGVELRAGDLEVVAHRAV